ncbi:FixH family protein [Deinococcus budaensis]|uniref:YtkA-like domain-containing protein n=1 Tax=Deinococcus budaensis TaxID=1665626 RepID=A0A7W8GES2_9DEIO|nr:hypothetical protein [Deinococcus budaensis]
MCQASALAVCLLLSACQPPKARDFEVRLTTQPDPARVGSARMELTLPDVPAAAISLEGNMAHAGMAPVRAQATPTGNGRYVVDAFPLNMAGSWVVTVTARTDDGRTLTTDVPLEVFAP